MEVEACDVLDEKMRYFLSIFLTGKRLRWIEKGSHDWIREKMMLPAETLPGLHITCLLYLSTYPTVNSLAVSPVYNSLYDYSTLIFTIKSFLSWWEVFWEPLKSLSYWATHSGMILWGSIFGSPWSHCLIEQHTLAWSFGVVFLGAPEITVLLSNTLWHDPLG